jgi:hypothetical protein
MNSIIDSQEDDKWKPSFSFNTKLEFLVSNEFMVESLFYANNVLCIDKAVNSIMKEISI